MKTSYKQTLYASYLGYISQAIIVNLAPLLFATFQREFAVSLDQIAFLVTFNFGTQMLVDLLAAKYVDRIGYRTCIVTAHICCTLGLIGMGVFPYLLSGSPYLGLLLATVINAIGGGLIEVLVSPIVEALPSEEKSSAMSLLHSFYCWGHVTVVLLSTLYFSLAGTSHWYFLPLLWALVPLFNTFLFARVPIRTLPGADNPVPMRQLFSIKIFWILLLLMVCAGASEQAMSQWASLFAELGLGVSKTMGDLLGPCAFAALMGLSRLFYGRSGGRINLKNFLMTSGALCVVSYLLAVFSPWPLLSLIGCGFCGLSVGIMWPGAFSLAAERCPQGGTAMFAILALSGDVGCFSGPGLVGVVSGAVQEAINRAGSWFLPGSPTEAALKTGLLCAILFPMVLMVCVSIVKRHRAPVA